MKMKASYSEGNDNENINSKDSDMEVCDNKSRTKKAGTYMVYQEHDLGTMSSQQQ